MSTGEGLLHPTPLRLFRPMWESGLFLNCNVYWDCPINCRYCFARLNREAHHVVGKSATDESVGKLARLVNKVFGSRYNPSDALQFFLHEQYPIMVCNNTDPLSALEVAHGYTKQYLDLFAQAGSPVNLLSKFQGWAQLDQGAYIETFKSFERMWVSVTITSDDIACTDKWEPGAPSGEDRLAVVKQLTDAGIDVDVRVIPFLFDDAFPGGQWDDPETYRPFIQKIKAAGAFGVSVAPLDLSIYHAPVLDQVCRQFAHGHEWCRADLDRKWRYWAPDTDIMRTVSQIWYDLATAEGLKCGIHQAFNSQVCAPGDVHCAVVGPDWFDTHLSWVHVAHGLRDVQREHGGAPVVTTAAEVAAGAVEGHRHADHVFSWKSWRDSMPRPKNDMDYVIREQQHAEGVMLADVMEWQMHGITKWEDTIWADTATAPLTPEPGAQLYDDELGVVITYDAETPRDSWSAVRSDDGWDGRTADELDGAVFADGTDFTHTRS